MHASGFVRARMHLAGSKHFDYTLESVPEIAATETVVAENALTVRVPEPDIARWSTSDQITIAAFETLDEGGELRITVEKDFACLAPREGEDESDMYPHPKTDC